MEGGRIPADDSSMDVVWICLVLMCITDERALRRSIAEIDRVVRPDGLLFLVENTESRENLRHLSYRSVEEYQSLFTFAKLEHAGDYHDLGERISILTGRKHRGL
jgi:ubiquinone/menaquinone biosynthesis C-methylase UbiE